MATDPGLSAGQSSSPVGVHLGHTTLDEEDEDELEAESPSDRSGLKVL